MAHIKSAAYFSDISEERNGFKFAKPVRPDEKALTCVVPIIQKEVHDRSYITLPETQSLKMNDSGKIDQMVVRNDGTDPVFLRSGTLLKGNTQERAVVRSYILFPGDEVMVEARCVHQSKPIRVGSEVHYAGVTPLVMDQQLYRSGFHAADQHKFWDSTATYSSHTNLNIGADSPVGSSDNTTNFARFGVKGSSVGMSGYYGRQNLPTPPPLIRSNALFSGTISSNFQAYGGADRQFRFADDLVQQQAEFTASVPFLDILSKLKLVDDQAGLAILDEQGMSTIELFDVHASWKALHEDAVKRAGTNLVRDDSDDLFEFKEDRAVKAVRKVLQLDFKENEIFDSRAKDGRASVRVIGLTADKYVGELVELDGRVIHVLVNRVA